MKTIVSLVLSAVILGGIATATVETYSGVVSYAQHVVDVTNANTTSLVDQVNAALPGGAGLTQQTQP